MAPEATRTLASAKRAGEVRAFYESHPYPKPFGDLDRHRELYRNPDRRRAWSLLLWPTEKPNANREILVAGCGTSQAAIHALREPDARVTTIDISETSLRHTRDLQRKYGLRNLDLHRLAIEEVGELGRTFDQIVCTGVLHHLPDPDVGLRSLCNVLAPNGALHLMVYATYGRAGIYMMQEYCRLLGVGTAETELRDLGAMIRRLSADHPIAGVATRTKDFTYPDALADALLHPQDRAFSLPQLYAWLERCGLSFAESQPITFGGDAWRGYVPLRLPWTLCIRDRVPPGYAAVLINRAHSYSDLALPINAAQERVFAAMDRPFGRRDPAACRGRGWRGAGPQVYRAAMGIRSDRVRCDQLAPSSERMKKGIAPVLAMAMLARGQSLAQSVAPVRDTGVSNEIENMVTRTTTRYRLRPPTTPGCCSLLSLFSFRIRLGEQPTLMARGNAIYAEKLQAYCRGRRGHR